MSIIDAEVMNARIKGERINVIMRVIMESVVNVIQELELLGFIEYENHIRNGHGFLLKKHTTD